MRERSSIGCASKPTCTAPPPSVIPHAPSGRAAPPILSRCRVPPARASTSNEQHASAASQHVAPTSTTPAPPPSQLQQGPPAPSGSTPSHLAAPPPAHAQLAAAAAAVQGAVPDDDDLVTVYETEEVDEDVTVPAPPARSHTAAAPAQQSVSGILLNRRALVPASGCLQHTTRACTAPHAQSRPSSTATATAASHQSQQRTHGQHPSTSAKPGVAAVGAAAAPPPPLAASSLTSTHSMQQTVSSNVPTVPPWHTPRSVASCLGLPGPAAGCHGHVPALRVVRAPSLVVMAGQRAAGARAAGAGGRVGGGGGAAAGGSAGPRGERQGAARPKGFAGPHPRGPCQFTLAEPHDFTPGDGNRMKRRGWP